MLAKIGIGHIFSVRKDNDALRKETAAQLTNDTNNDRNASTAAIPSKGPIQVAKKAVNRSSLSSVRNKKRWRISNTV